MNGWTFTYTPGPDPEVGQAVAAFDDGNGFTFSFSKTVNTRGDDDIGSFTKEYLSAMEAKQKEAALITSVTGRMQAIAESMGVKP